MMFKEEFIRGIRKMANEECQRTRREQGLPRKPFHGSGCESEICSSSCPFKAVGK